MAEMTAIRVGGVSPSSVGNRLREIVATVDPALQVRDVRPFDVALREEHLAMRMRALGIAVVIASVLLRSAAGIYAMMSFTVERRRREIGIRMALGADRGRVVRGIFARALGQLAIGVGVGIVLALVFLRVDGPMTAAKVVTLFVVSVMLLVGLLASVGRRGGACGSSRRKRSRKDRASSASRRAGILPFAPVWRTIQGASGSEAARSQPGAGSNSPRTNGRLAEGN